MDDALRALAREVLDGPADAAAVARLDAALDRAGADLPRELLLRHPRWRRLVDLVNGWFRRPFAKESRLPAGLLDKVAGKLGRPLPRALREACELAVDWSPALDALRRAAGQELPAAAPEPAWTDDLPLDDLLLPAWRWSVQGVSGPELLAFGQEVVGMVDEVPYGVSLVEPSSPDPPVLWPGGDEGAFVEAAPSVSAFVAGAVLRRAYEALRRVHDAARRGTLPVSATGPACKGLHDRVRSGDIAGASLAAVQDELPRLELAGVAMTGVYAPLLTVHGDERGETLLFVVGASRGIVAARTEGAWAEVERRLAGS